MSAAADVRDIYRLTPLQEGILFHTLLEPDQNFYIDQLSVTLDMAAPGDVDRIRMLFEALVDRHAVLRTGFIWQGQEHPLQLVAGRVELPIAHHDWSDRAGPEIEGLLAGLLASEREAGFDLARPPLLRVAVATLPGGACQLVVTYHHIILDAWSVANLFAEFKRAWRDGPGALGEVPRFRDYVRSLGARELAGTERFWRDHLRDLPGPVALDSADAGSADAAPITGGACTVSLGAGDSEGLRAAARGLSVTLATLVHAAWARLLGLYAGVDDVVIGVTFAGRPADLPGASGMVGLCINTLPLRVRTPAGETVGDWLRNVHGQLAAVRRHEFTPLQKVLDWSGLDRGVPLFHSVVAFENVPGLGDDGADGGGLAARDGQYYFRTNYPLNLLVVPGATLSLRINYDANRYREETIRRCLAQLASLLRRLAASPDAPLGAIGLVDPAETATLRPLWFGEARAYPDDRCIHALVSARAAAAPDAVAVTDGREHWTYAWIERRSNALAHTLREQGVRPESRVAVSAHRSADLVVALLAILKAGGSYVPLDPLYPAPRIAKMLDVSRPALLLCAPDLRDALPAADCPVIELTADPGESDAPPAIAIQPDNAAYVIFTSGSSGVPKGIELAHRGLCNMIPDWNRRFAVAAGDRLLQFASISFDASVWEIFSALTAGATLCIASRATLYAAEDLLGALRDLEITHALLPPSLLGSMDPDQLPSLRCIAAIGERCTGDIARRWSPGRRFFNAYGPAEATITDSIYELPAGTSPAGDPPIGRPMANVRLYALDRCGNPVPAGVPGELAIGGVNLARGYIGQPAATAAKFVPDPLADEPGARMYRSGDQVLLRPEGDFQYLGRIDQQVKIRGARVELGEIENALRAHPDVRDAVVLALDWPGVAEKRLVAYLVANAQEPPTPLLRAYLRERLPEAMIPAAFVALPRFPVNANGKIDRTRFPEPHWGRADDIGDLREPRTEYERRLASVWAKVLRLERVGIDDNYFDLGGDSIISIRLVAAAQREGLDLSPRDIFEHQTIAALAAARGDSAAPDDVRPAMAADGAVPALPMQQRFLAAMGASIGHYNQAVLLRPDPGLTAERARSALRALVDRHDALRLRAAAGAEGWQLHVDPPGSRDPLFAAVAAEGDAEAAMLSLHRALDPAAARVLGALWIEGGPGALPGLMLAVHHLAVDAVSWSVLLDDLATAFRGESLGAAPPSFVAAAAALGRAVADGRLAEHRARWQRLVGDASPAAAGIPATARAATSVTRLPSRTVTRLKALLPEHGHVGDIVLAALAQAAGPGCSIDLESDGRAMPEIPEAPRGAVGWFTAIAPFRLPGEAALTRPGLLAVSDARREWEKASYSYGALCQLDPANDACRDLLGEPRRLLVNWLGRLDGRLPDGAPFRLARGSTGPERDPDRPRLYDFELNAWLDADELVLSWIHPDAEAARALVGDVEEALEGGDGAAQDVDSDLSAGDLDRVLALVGRGAASPVAS